jgi:hypothetical protein
MRLNEGAILEVSAPEGPTEKQVRRRGRYSLVIGILAAALLVAAVAYADNLDDSLAAGSVTNPTINVGGSFSTTINYQVQKTGSNNTTFPATVNFALSGAPAWVSLDASSRAFSGYSDVQSITVSGTAPNGSGGTTYNFSVVPSTSAANLNPNPAKVDMSVTVNAPTPSDSTPPSISYVLDPASPDGSNGWYVSDVTLTWTVTESESPGSLVKTGCVDQNITADQDEQTYSCSATSDGGSAGPVEVKIKRDATDPDVSVTGFADGDVFVKGVHTLPSVGCDRSDATSGLDASGSTGPTITAGGLNANGVGSVTYTCGAQDNAGNQNSASASYSVVFNWTGFYRPVDNPSTVNMVKAGSAIPLKFSLGGDEGVGIFAAGFPASKELSCDPTAPVDAVEETVTAGQSTLQYDATTNQYTYVWKTDKSWAGKCRTLQVKLNDGTSHYALFRFTK